MTTWRSFPDVRREMNRLQEEMTRLFDRWGTNGQRASAVNVYPALNLWEDEGHLYVEAELPGLELNDLEIYITGENMLSLKGERKAPDAADGTWHRRERGFGVFSRLIELPCLVNSDKVTAEFQHGVLTITMPKREEARPKRIAVKTN